MYHHNTNVSIKIQEQQIPLIEKTIQYLTAAGGKSEEVASRVATDVIKFFNKVSHTSHETHTDIILTQSTLIKYIHILKEQRMAPSTIIDKLRNLRLLLEYLSTKSSHNISERCESVMKWLQKRSKTLRKDVKQQQMVNALRGEQEVDNATNPEEFWTNDRVKSDVDDYFELQEQPEAGIS